MAPHPLKPDLYELGIWTSSFPCDFLMVIQTWVSMEIYLQTAFLVYGSEISFVAIGFLNVCLFCLPLSAPWPVLLVSVPRAALSWPVYVLVLPVFS